MSLLGSISSGGSSNSARGYSESNGWSNSYTNGAGATASSNIQANLANTNSAQAWQKAAEFNAAQAQIQRDWQEKMANTVYQRSVKDMKAAGINPILAAGMGLGTASIGSGATASMSAPEIFMGNSFADQTSASQNQSYSENESHGNSWENSTSGLATALQQIGGLINSVLGGIKTGMDINMNLNGLEKLFKDSDKEDSNNNGYYDTSDSIEGLSGVLSGTKTIGSWLVNELNPFNSPIFGEYKKHKNAVKNLTDAKTGKKIYD